MIKHEIVQSGHKLTVTSNSITTSGMGNSGVRITTGVCMYVYYSPINNELFNTHRNKICIKPSIDGVQGPTDRNVALPLNIHITHPAVVIEI